MFVGREKELAFLETAYQKKRGQLIFLYGRRRVGKTETLQEFCKEKPHVFYACTKSPDGTQLEKFSKQLLAKNPAAAKYISSFQSWEDAFRSIADLPFGDEKQLVIIDEFPYMTKQNESIPSILQNLWDHELKNKNVMIVLCGSAMSYIEDELLSEENPLYGRATGIYKMTEMDFYDAIQFFPNFSYEEKIAAYAILGGIPHYLKEFDDSLPLKENIQQNILTKGCILYSEVEFLLHEELRETTQYNALIEAVALGNTDLNSITQKAMFKSTAATSVYLANLMELGLVEKQFPVDVPVKKKANRQKGVYVLKDNFFRFWYAFVFSNYSELEMGDVQGVCDYAIMPQLDAFVSRTFEDICLQYIQHLQLERQLPFRYEKIGFWEGKTTVRRKDKVEVAQTEIDILALSEKEAKYLIGECKYKNSPFSYSEYLDTLAKLGPQQENNEFFYVLFSRHGFDPKILAEANTNPHLTLCEPKDIIF